jgi:hypothetical protein
MTSHSISVQAYLFLEKNNYCSKSSGAWKVLSSGIQCCAVWWKSADVLKKNIAYIFRGKEYPSKKLAWSRQQAEHTWCCFLAWLILQPWQYVPPNCWLTWLHGVISQKIENFIATDLKSNLLFCIATSKHNLHT